MKGRIVKVGGGRFSVMTETGIAEYSAKGSLKIKGEGLVTGDIAEIENGVVTGTAKRKNRFFRPNVCNVDVVNIVVGDPPKPDFYLVDKMISKCFFENIPCVITVNKIDLGEENKRKILENYEKAVEKIFFVSALDGAGIDELTEYLKGKLVVFTGQSAVGKTSLCNRLFGGSRRVGDLSEKTKRGRQTTTSCEIVRSGDLLVARGLLRSTAIFSPMTFLILIPSSDPVSDSAVLKTASTRKNRDATSRKRSRREISVANGIADISRF